VTSFDRLASAWGIDLDPPAREQYRTIVERMRGALDTLAAAPEPRFETLHGSPERHDGRTDVWPPDAESDPYNAWIHRCRVAGAPDGPLTDLTLGVKDNVAVGGLPCTAGSEALASFVPEIDATVVGRLLDAGVVLLGKQNMDAFAMGDAGELQDFGPTWNPHDEARLAGGSSSGSAAAVAAGDCDVALGTDQAGSVRTPAAWCGVVGCKPTYGLVPYTGVFGMDFGFDHVGVLSRTVRDNARVLETIAGEDRQDGCRLDPRQPRDRPGDSLLDGDTRAPDELTIGVLAEGFGWPTAEAGVEATVSAAIDDLDAAGVTVESVSAPAHELGPAIVGIAAALGSASTYRQGGVGTTTPGWHWTAGRRAFTDALAERTDALSPAVVGSLLFAEACREAGETHEYAHAKNVALTLGQEYDRCLDGCDVLALPTVPRVAIEYDEEADRTERVERLATLPVNTAGANQTGHPALSVPCGTVDGLPVGLQLIGGRFEEATLYRVGELVEETVETAR
jgi:amidase